MHTEGRACAKLSRKDPMIISCGECGQWTTLIFAGPRGFHLRLPPILTTRYPILAEALNVKGKLVDEDAFSCPHMTRAGYEMFRHEGGAEPGGYKPSLFGSLSYITYSQIRCARK